MLARTPPLAIEDVVYGADETICEFIRQRIPALFNGAYDDRSAALGILKKGRLVGGVLFNMYSGNDIFMSAAFDEPCLTRANLNRLFSYPFVQLKCRRMTTITGETNTHARAIDERLGFTQEGIVRCAFPNDENAIVYGMLREECRWLRG